MTKLHFFSASDGTALTKRFSMTEEGLQKHSYPMVRDFISHEVEVETTEDFLVQLAAHAQNGNCLLKGQLDCSLNNESRAGHTSSDTPTDWLVLDNDNLHDLKPQALMDLLGLGDVDYIVQYSSSSGIEPGKNGYHIFFLLDHPWAPADLKLVLRSWNLDHRAIREHFQLSRTNNNLRWPLDVSVCQNDKLIYIAPPVLGPGVTDELEVERIQLVEGSRRVATLMPASEPDELLRQRENGVLNQLRANARLPAKELKTKTVHGEIVVSNPDQAQITGRKEERGFVYLNLNGGNSWAYYHPVTSPEVLYNFKDEPNCLISELLPDYHPQALERAEKARDEQQLDRQSADMEQQNQRIREAEENGDKFLQAFRDKLTDQYYVGWIDPQNQTHDLDQIGTKGKISDYYAQYDLPKIEIVPSVSFNFEPANNALYNFEAGFINRYTPPCCLKNAKHVESSKVPLAIQRVINHVLGGDPAVVEHFLNWLAVIFRYRIRTQTAWILQGTTGTGKGLLFSKIIQPLIGDEYCRLVNLTNLEEQFNGFAEHTIVLLVDEVDTDQVKDMPKLIARFKSMITEPRLPLRAMRQDLREVPNHLNLILSSNQPNSMRIEANDRRFNVCPRQEEKLFGPDESGDELVAQIKSELPDFADYLMSREADQAKARQTLDNVPKRLLQVVTQTAIEEVAEAFRSGDLGYFVANRPVEDRNSIPSGLGKFDENLVRICAVYGEFLTEALNAADVDRKHVVLHKTLFAVFELLVGDMPKTKAKLSKRLGHQHLTIESHTQGSISLRGLGVHWQATPEQLAEWRELLDEEVAANTAPDSGRPPRTLDFVERSSFDGTKQ